MPNSSQVSLIVMLFIIATQVRGQEHAALNFSETGSMTAWMRTNLALTESQVPEVEDINVKYAQKNLVLQTGYLTRKQRLQSTRANDLAKDEELKKILTPEQFAAWQSKKKEIEKSEKEKLKERRHRSNVFFKNRIHYQTQNVIV